jgi:hypothetical protein
VRRAEPDAKARLEIHHEDGAVTASEVPVGTLAEVLSSDYSAESLAEPRSAALIDGDTIAAGLRISLNGRRVTAGVGIPIGPGECVAVHRGS